jgi:Tol biopolymer transport system component
VFASDRDLENPRFDMFQVGRTKSHNDGFKGGITSASNIYVMDADGENIQQVTTGNDHDTRPSVSPDGRTVVFLSSREANTLHIWTVPTDGSQPCEKMKLDSKPWAGRPRYSLDGKELFFFSGISDGKYKPTGRHTLCRVPAIGGAWRVIPNDNVGISSHGADPDPDGKYLWYHAAADNLWGIYRLPLAGGDPVRFIPTGFAKHHIAHPTIARNGFISFDSRSYVQTQ